MKQYKFLMVIGVLVIPLLVNSDSFAQEKNIIEEVKAELKHLKQAYDTEIARLEARITELEKREVAAKPRAPEFVAEARVMDLAAQSSGPANSATAFNPQIGLIFNGRLTSFSNEPENYSIAGSPLGGETGVGPEGFALDETEINFYANVNNLFYASTTVALEASDEGVEVELEEAFIQTLSLPGGATLKAGRFFPAIGYLNENHSHSDNFSDRPLPYQAFLAGQYNDDGVQVAFVLPTELYLQIGAGAFRGADFPAGGASNDGLGAYSAFARVGGDIGFSNSWRFGLSFLHADATGRTTGGEEALPLETLSFSGNTDLLIADFKYQWSPNGNTTDKYFVLQGELMRRYQDGSFNDIAFSGQDTGFYVESIYKFIRNFRVGYRYSQLYPENTIPLALLGTDLDAAGISPNNHSFMVDWAHNEFSLLRLQFSTERTQFNTDSRFYLQYIMSIGAHGAHSF